MVMAYQKTTDIEGERAVAQSTPDYPGWSLAPEVNPEKSKTLVKTKGIEITITKKLLLSFNTSPHVLFGNIKLVYTHQTNQL